MPQVADSTAVRREVEARLRAREEVVFALLFGSRASGARPHHDSGGTSSRRPRPGSDWDVAVYLDEGLSPRERFDLRLRLIADLEHVEGVGGLDLVILNDAPALLGHRTLQGKLLFARDRVAYVRYFVRTLAASGDEAHYRRIHREARRRRLEEGTFGRP